MEKGRGEMEEKGRGEEERRSGGEGQDFGPDKRVFVTEPLPKKAKPASTSEGDEDPWCHVHPDGNHPLKDCRQVNGLVARTQRQGGGTGPGACFSCGLHGHYSRNCPNGRQGGDGRGWGQGGGRGGHGGGRGGQGERGPNNAEFADNGDAPAPQGGGNGQFQEVNGVVGCIHGGACLPPSNSASKRLVGELNAVAPASLKPL